MLILYLFSFVECQKPNFLHISAFLQQINSSLSFVSLQNYKYFQNPFLLFTDRASSVSFTLKSSRFSYFSSPIVFSQMEKCKHFTLNVNDCTFRNSYKAIVLSAKENEGSAYDYVKNDFKKRIDVQADVSFDSCMFVSLFGIVRSDESQYGGALYSNGFNIDMKNCVFSMNNANYGGACYFENLAASIDKCTFTKNQGLVKTGAIELRQCSIANINDCNFVENVADSIGTITAIKSKINIEAVIFQNNKAQTLSSVLYSANSSLKLIAIQFFQNECLKNNFNLVLLSSNCDISLTSCKFSSSAQENKFESPIKSDKKSSIIIKMSCFDCSSNIIQRNILGEVDLSSQNSFDETCLCEPFNPPNYAEEIKSKISSSSEDESQFVFLFIFELIIIIEILGLLFLLFQEYIF